MKKKMLVTIQGIFEKLAKHIGKKYTYIEVVVSVCIVTGRIINQHQVKPFFLVFSVNLFLPTQRHKSYDLNNTSTTTVYGLRSTFNAQRSTVMPQSQRDFHRQPKNWILSKWKMYTLRTFSRRFSYVQYIYIHIVYTLLVIVYTLLENFICRNNLFFIQNENITIVLKIFQI